MGTDTAAGWFACDMDTGVLHHARTRAEAVAWLLEQHEGPVLARHAYGPGSYEYVIGGHADEASSWFVLRADRLAGSGFSHRTP